MSPPIAERDALLAVVWVVRYGNYEPPEVVGIYDNEAAAQAHQSAGNHQLEDVGLHVERWTVGSEYRRSEGLSPP